jgi:hypothetical protein
MKESFLDGYCGFSLKKAFTTEAPVKENPKPKHQKPKQRQPNNPNLEKIQNLQSESECLET